MERAEWEEKHRKEPKKNRPYVDSGRVFTWEDGRPYHPEYLSQVFSRLIQNRELGLPPIRLHDLRHCAATLGVADVRRFLVRLEKDTTAATAKESHRVLRSALSSACREELITRNVAKLVEPPRTDNRELKPWTLDETLDFLAASRKDPLYAAFVLAIAMGLRRGEIIGLRWSDLDLDNRVLYVRQQTQRRRGVLYDDDPKSRRRRVVPLPALCIAPLRWHRMRQAAARVEAGERWQESGYVFTTRTGRQVEPRNVYRSFTRVAQSAGLRVIRLHDARHGTATLLTAARGAPRVVMEILGHSQISITMDVYTHVVHDTQREAISHMDRLLKRRPVVSDRPR